MKNNVDDLHAICELTFHLTELRQRECSNLSIEDFSPKLFAELLVRLKEFRR
jgi:hypothetical protein